MNTTFKKTLTGALAALTLGAAVAASATPAAAGWDSHHGLGLGPFLGGLAFGAIVGAATETPYGGDCYVVRQPAYDSDGNFMGYRPQQVCN